MKSDMKTEWLYRIRKAQTPDTLASLVRGAARAAEAVSNGDNLLLQDPEIEAELMSAATDLYLARGQSADEAQLSAEALFYPGTKPWVEPDASPNVIPAPAAVFRIAKSDQIVPPENPPEGPFDWVEYSGMRARYGGGTRGWDEAGHETFIVELSGDSYYGEIRKIFRSNRRDFDVEINSFGYWSEDYVGALLPPASARLSKEIEQIQLALVNMVGGFAFFKRKPLVTKEYQNSNFTGQLIFKAGWALVLQPHDGEES